MAYLIGTDEAGYGPNLGPLVVTACVWHVPQGVRHDNLYQRLEPIVTATRPSATDLRLWLADSKALYRPGTGLKHLERGVLATVIAPGDQPPVTWRNLVARLVADDHEQLATLPWYADFDESLPLEVEIDQLQAAAASWTAGIASEGVRLVAVQSRLVFAGRFNEQLVTLGNKSNVLSSVTIELIRQQLSRLGNESIYVLCDKHGGRNKYRPLLQTAFEDCFVEIRGESRQQSHYRLGPPERRIEFCFQAKADHVLAAALASMVSKYLRELAMRGFNRFWRLHDPELRPTAGYPVDARRFKQQIAALQSGLGITDQILWRER